MAFTYNDPVIFLEYAVDVAAACLERGIKTVAVTAGYICPEPRTEFFRHIDAANIDLKAFTEEFYYQLCGAHLQPVLDTLVYLKNETDVWFEVTTLLIPVENDSDAEVERLAAWFLDNLGSDAPLHFTAFHPDFKMRDKPRTPHETLLGAQRIARAAGLNYVYVGNVHDEAGSSTYCPGCGIKVIGRDWYVLSDGRLDRAGRCTECATPVAGAFDGPPGTWGAKRQPVRLRQAATT